MEHLPHSPTLLAKSYMALPLHKLIGTGPDRELCCSSTRCSCGSCPKYVGSSPVNWLCSNISHCRFFSLLRLSGKGPLQHIIYKWQHKQVRDKISKKLHAFLQDRSMSSLAYAALACMLLHSLHIVWIPRYGYSGPRCCRLSTAGGCHLCNASDCHKPAAEQCTCLHLTHSNYACRHTAPSRASCKYLTSTCYPTGRDKPVLSSCLLQD
jgi:hypothetical protein